MTAKYDTDDIESAISKLLEQKKEITLKDIAAETALPFENTSNRRAIQRVLKDLITQGVIQAKGKARARSYVLTTKVQPSADTQNDTFNDIPLSNESKELQRYITQPIRVREPVGFNQHFLRFYTPNQTFYLPQTLRDELFSVGKVENIVRPAGTYARHILNRLLIDLSWNSSRLEGNTYSLLETKRLIELGETAEGKNAIEAQMILNHKDAIEYIVESADDMKISGHEICSVHALLSNNLIGDASASGRIRSIAVGISGTTYLPLDNPHVLKELFDLFVEKLNLIEDPFEQSFFALIHLSYLQTFEDVNKRTARLVANIPLIQNNLKPLSFIDVEQHHYVTALLGIYEKNDVSLLRDLFCWAYKRSAQRYSAIQQTMGEPNLLKLKYRNIIQDIIRTIILEKIASGQVVSAIKQLIEAQHFAENEAMQLQQLIESEIMNLHEGNIARYRIRPSEFQDWKKG